MIICIVNLMYSFMKALPKEDVILIVEYKNNYLLYHICRYPESGVPSSTV
jgi:hypothetical protein